jgi:hypothetical protein
MTKKRLPSIITKELVTEARTIGNDDLVSHASKGFTYDYTLTGPRNENLITKLGSKQTPNIQRVLGLIQKDAVALAGINKIVDRAIENGWYVRGLDGKSKEKKAILQMKELRFNSILRKTLFHVALYGNAFIEIVRDGNGEVTELNVLEPTFMRIEADNVGQVMLYWQDVLGDGKRGNNQPEWNPEDIVHIKNSFLTTSVWGDVDLMALETVISSKLAVKNFVHWMFTTNQFRTLFTFPQTASDSDIKDFLLYSKAVQYDPAKPLAVRGDGITAAPLRDFKDGTQMLDWLRKMDEETLVLMGVPPMIAGQGGSGDRSTGDTYVISVNTKVKSLQKLYSEVITFDLLPRIGYEKVEFVFEPPDKKNVKDIIEIAEKMINMKVKPEFVEQYMNAEGFDLSDGEESIFYTPEEQAAQGLLGKQNVTGSMDQYASRQGKSDLESSKRIGTGSDGTSRRDQLVQHADSDVERRFKRVSEFW